MLTYEAMYRQQREQWHNNCKESWFQVTQNITVAFSQLCAGTEKDHVPSENAKMTHIQTPDSNIQLQEKYWSCQARRRFT